jgi:carboxymethylenebutenolidase
MPRITTERDHTAYLARPTTAPRATVAVLHGWWGLTSAITGACDDLARHGYAAVAPDLYQGQVAHTPAEAQALRGVRRAGSTWRRIVSAIDAVHPHDGRLPLGLLGFSMGGHWAYWLASQARAEVPVVSATVVYYAVRRCDFAASCSAFQIHLAETDPFVSAAGIRGLVRDLNAVGRAPEVHTYPGTGHWFAEIDRPEAYQARAARLAWDRTNAFFDHTIGSGSTPRRPPFG